MIWNSNLPDSSAPRITYLLKALMLRATIATHIEHVDFRARNYRPYQTRRDVGISRPKNPKAYGPETLEYQMKLVNGFDQVCDGNFGEMWWRSELDKKWFKVSYDCGEKKKNESA